MKSISIEFMQKSFIASLALSFVLSFAVAAYLSSPFTVHVQTVRAAADELPAEEQEVVATTTSAIPFSDLNVISLIEIPSEAARTTAAAAPTERSAPVQTPTQKTKKVSNQHAHPVRLIIPSIGLNAPIESVGLNNKGEMAVPDGSTNEVGWYKYGTIPGNVGSAVIDAHVYAAFNDLRYLKVGSEVFVENTDGERLKFVVDDSRVYKLGELSSGALFGKRDARRLNLITCAGEPTSDGSTYTHRLVVYTKLAA